MGIFIELYVGSMFLKSPFDILVIDIIPYVCLN